VTGVVAGIEDHESPMTHARRDPHPTLLTDDEHDRQLADNVAPSGWKNPEPAPRYNLVVLGAGTAGLVAAAGAAGLGARVALVERSLMGGDCLNVGCVPSKALIATARAYADARDAGTFGVRVEPPIEVDFAAAMERMRRLRAEISRNDSAARFRELGVDVFFGGGRFVDGESVAVGETRLRFQKAVIATGGRASAPPIPGLAEGGYATNETVFSLTTLPRRLAVIGAGPIGCELAQAFRRLGAEVFLIEAAHGVLPREDRDAAEVVRRALLADGVDVLCCGKNARVSGAGGERRISLESHAGPVELAVDEILVAVGRRPNVEDLGLEAAGVEYDGGGVRVDDRLRTTNPRIYAAGDVCPGYQFTHNSDFQARIVIQNALFLGRAKASALTMPWVTYTDPEVAHVGLDEAQAAGRGIAVDTYVQRFVDVDRAVLEGETDGFVKVHVKKGTDRILGATIVARAAGEMLPELTLAIGSGIGLGRIARTIHPYPTRAEAIRKLGDQYGRTRLTPRVKRLFELWLRWSRR
jgi:pyruvate/2-oxoglutarate dehydrogenase complex dihydrolipoamide dehydrogenase (E3) component